MVVCLNAYYVNMWINVIRDLGKDPRIVINKTKTIRKALLPKHTSNEFVLNLASYAVSNVVFDFTSGYLSFDTVFDGEQCKLNIPCESITHVFAKDPSMYAMMLEDVVNLKSDDGFMFSLEKMDIPEIIKFSRS